MHSESTCRLLDGPAELDASRKIVQRVYAAQGYVAQGGSDITGYLDIPEAKTFGLFFGETLFGTISLVPDNPRGLPMDSVYAEELSPWRAEGKKLAEVVQFAVDHEMYAAVSGEKTSPFVAIPLFAAVLSHAIRNNIDYFCISINPKHTRFYELVGFTQIGALKHYRSVDAPAIAYALSVSTWKTNPAAETFLGKEILRHMTDIETTDKQP